MADTLKLCVSCKACRRECPTGVDIARMKIEVLAARAEKYGLSLRDRMIAYLPRYAPYAARASWLMNLRDLIPGAAKLSEAVTGLSARRTLPRWRSDWFRDREGATESADVVLFADTFNRYFEPENLRAALRVLHAGGYRVALATPTDGARPLCCGRTFMAAGKVREARREAERTIAVLAPFAARGATIVGLEPSCIMGFRDEIPAMIKGDAARLLSGRVVLFEEFLAREAEEGRLNLSFDAIPGRALLHGHCHQKSFDTMGAVEATLRLVPDLAVEMIESSCCGMAGSFGFNAETIDVSLAMGELSLLPAIRQAPADAIVVANGTSCRHQIRDGTGRHALHVARVLAQGLTTMQ
jgi:Fe-S oxidoreductase